MVEIEVGSTSVHKVGPVQRVCKIITPLSVQVTGHEVETLVSNQPFGMKETMRGAENRANAVWSPGKIAIGIEGGLIDLPSQMNIFNTFLSKIPFLGKKYRKPIVYLCVAVVAVKDINGQMYYATSAGMQFPSDAIAEAKRRGVTVGVVLADLYGGDHTDPRAIISFNRVHRGDSIEEAVKLALMNVF